MTTGVTGPIRAAVYARISRDKEGAGLGVERQEADCRALADQLGWEVVAVFTDNDISAYSGKPRPGYRAMVEAVRAGTVRGVLAWHTDRLHRRNVELETFVSLVEAHAVQVQTVTSGEVNLLTPDGRMFARMLGAAAQRELEHGRDRMRRAKTQAADQGRFRGGKRPFGYERDGMTIRAAEAAVIRQCTEAVLAGRSLKALAKELTEAGVVTSRGATWTPNLLRAVLLRPRNAGLIGRNPVAGVGPEVIGPATWPAVVDPDTWRAVVAVITDPGRRTNHSNVGLRWLGSMIYRCGVVGCGAPMRPSRFGGVAAGRPDTSRGFHYRCLAKAHLTIHAVKTDEFVRRAVAQRVRDPRIVAALTSADGDTDGHLAADRARRAVLVADLVRFDADYAAGLLTGAERHRFAGRATDEIASIDARLTVGIERSSVSPVLTAHDPGAAFLAAPIDVQRSVLSAVLTVTVVPQTTRGAVWSAGRLHLEPVV